MTIQTVLLGIFTPIFLGAVFHLWRGGAAWRLGLYIILALAGFWLAHFTAQRFEWQFLKVGGLQMGVGTVGSLIFMGLGHWLSNKEPETSTNRKKPAKYGGRK